ncbi:MAG TPA: NUDIX hydrolase N-terminal domain-containing protein [Acetobacteraceae bacterium]|nr:NUDIX hydrolase N-terminal domain-containing protein [Acetobacteraceae bacterium]
MTGETEPAWLVWAREIQAIAQTGLAFTKDPYDAERFTALRGLAAHILAHHTSADARRIEALFAGETGYATPKIDVRAAVFDAQGRILMVRETADQGRWTLPGGWADVNQTLAECVVREVEEESGYLARVVKLAAVWDRARQGHTPGVFSCAKLFFVCALEGGAPRASLETSECAWFPEDAIPADLSRGRVLPSQIARMFVHWREPGRATEFE